MGKLVCHHYFPSLILKFKKDTETNRSTVAGANESEILKLVSELPKESS